MVRSSPNLPDRDSVPPTNPFANRIALGAGGAHAFVGLAMRGPVSMISKSVMTHGLRVRRLVEHARAARR
jgi:hypothetical protein